MDKSATALLQHLIANPHIINQLTDVIGILNSHHSTPCVAAAEDVNDKLAPRASNVDVLIQNRLDKENISGAGSKAVATTAQSGRSSQQKQAQQHDNVRRTKTFTEEQNANEAQPRDAETRQTHVQTAATPVSGDTEHDGSSTGGGGALLHVNSILLHAHSDAHAKNEEGQDRDALYQISSKEQRIRELEYELAQRIRELNELKDGVQHGNAGHERGSHNLETRPMQSTHRSSRLGKSEVAVQTHNLESSGRPTASHGTVAARSRRADAMEERDIPVEVEQSWYESALGRTSNIRDRSNDETICTRNTSKESRAQDGLSPTLTPINIHQAVARMALKRERAGSTDTGGVDNAQGIELGSNGMMGSAPDCTGGRTLETSFAHARTHVDSLGGSAPFAAGHTTLHTSNTNAHETMNNSNISSSSSSFKAGYSSTNASALAQVYHSSSSSQIPAMVVAASGQYTTPAVRASLIRAPNPTPQIAGLSRCEPYAHASAAPMSTNYARRHRTPRTPSLTHADRVHATTQRQHSNRSPALSTNNNDSSGGNNHVHRNSTISTYHTNNDNTNKCDSSNSDMTQNVVTTDRTTHESHYYTSNAPCRVSPSAAAAPYSSCSSSFSALTTRRGAPGPVGASLHILSNIPADARIVSHDRNRIEMLEQQQQQQQQDGEIGWSYRRNLRFTRVGGVASSGNSSRRLYGDHMYRNATSHVRNINYNNNNNNDAVDGDVAQSNNNTSRNILVDKHIHVGNSSSNRVIASGHGEAESAAGAGVALSTEAVIHEFGYAAEHTAHNSTHLSTQQYVVGEAAPLPRAQTPPQNRFLRTYGPSSTFTDVHAKVGATQHTRGAVAKRHTDDDVHDDNDKMEDNPARPSRRRVDHRGSGAIEEDSAKVSHGGNSRTASSPRNAHGTRASNYGTSSPTKVPRIVPSKLPSAHGRMALAATAPACAKDSASAVAAAAAAAAVVASTNTSDTSSRAAMWPQKRIPNAGGDDDDGARLRQHAPSTITSPAPLRSGTSSAVASGPTRSPSPLNPKRGPSLPRRFIFTGLKEDEPARLREAIAFLGQDGSVVECDLDEPPPFYTTHIVLRGTPRSVKALCGVVSGKWLVPPEYVYHSATTGFWLDEYDEGGLRLFPPPLKCQRFVLAVEHAGIREKLCQVILYGGGEVVGASGTQQQQQQQQQAGRENTRRSTQKEDTHMHNRYASSAAAAAVDDGVLTLTSGDDLLRYVTNLQA